MGRPINKRNFGDLALAGNQIKITGDVGFGITAGFIVRQKSTREFIVNLGGNVGRVRLVDNITPGVGEAFIDLFEDGSDADGSGADYTIDMALTTVAIATPGLLHSVADTLTIVDGAGSSTAAATLNIVDVIPVNGQTEANYDGAGENGSFVAGTVYANGTGNVLTMSDGTIITGTVAGNAWTAFTINNSSSAAQTSDGAGPFTSTVIPDTGSGFTLTLGVANQQLNSVTIIAGGDYQVLPASPAAVSSDGQSTPTDLITLTDWAVVTGQDGSAQVAPGTLYDQAPIVTISGGNGAGATATADIAGGAVTNVTIDTAGSGYTSIPVMSFVNAGRKFVERIKAHKVNATDGVQTQWDTTLGATPPDGQSKIDNDA